jgi:thiamine biosynthesis lipoprotein
MDTFAETQIISTSDSLGKEITAKIQEICEEAEGRISKTIETSEIYKFNEYSKIADTAPLVFDFSKETAELLQTAKYAKDITNGAYNPCFGRIIDLWDINNPDENAEHKLPEKDVFYSVLEFAQKADYEIKESGSKKYLESSNQFSAELDLGGIGKGYALDCIAEYLCGDDTQIKNALVTFGSSIIAVGKNKSGNLWRIGIKDPLNTEKICGTVGATDKVISVSGGYERFITINGINYSHIIDPETGYPVDNDLLCTVVMMNAKSTSQTKETQGKYKDNGAIADALSTALYVMGKDEAIKFYNSIDYKNNPVLDFEMILFVKSETDPKGYEIISTNIIFDEIK